MQRRTADSFEVPVGAPVLYGKYKNKKGKIVGFKRDEKGNPIVVVEPVPKGRKHNKEIQLFRIWPVDRATATEQGAWRGASVREFTASIIRLEELEEEYPLVKQEGDAGIITRQELLDRYGETMKHVRKFSHVVTGLSGGQMDAWEQAARDWWSNAARSQREKMLAAARFDTPSDADVPSHSFPTWDSLSISLQSALTKQLRNRGAIMVTPEELDAPPAPDPGDTPPAAQLLTGAFSLMDYGANKKNVVKKILKLIKDRVKREDRNPKTQATGFIYNMWRMGFHDVMGAKDLWNLFERGGPSLDAMAFKNEAAAIARTLNDFEAAAVSVMLLKSTKQQKLAKRLEALFVNDMLKTKIDPEHGGPPTMVPKRKLKTPAQMFKETVTPQIKAWAKEIWEGLGKDKGKAPEFVSDLASDINWSAGWKAVGPGTPLTEDDPRPGDYSPKLEWSLTPAAALMWAVLQLAGEKGRAKDIVKAALSDYPEAYTDMGGEKGKYYWQEDEA